jgi:hypothetical protein
MERRGSKPGEYRGGRKLGSANKKSVAIARAAMEKGITPIEVMADNMRFWHEKVGLLARRFETMLRNFEQMSEEDSKEAQRILGQMLMARDRSQQCAVDAAPYYHPKLASIDLNMVPGSKIVIEGGLPQVPEFEGETIEPEKDKDKVAIG